MLFVHLDRDNKEEKEKSNNFNVRNLLNQIVDHAIQG